MQPITSRAEALERWALAVEAQRAMQTLGAKPDARNERLLLQAFDSAFPCPHALMQFWEEVKKLTWPASAGTSPWEDIAAMGADLCEGKTLLEVDRPGGHRRAVQLLREHADQRWSQMAESGDGFAFVLQEHAVGKRPWTSIVHWANTPMQPMEAVIAGHTGGSHRWAARLSDDGSAAQVEYALDKQGHAKFSNALRHMLDPGDAAGAPAFTVPTRYASSAQAAQSEINRQAMRQRAA